MNGSEDTRPVRSSEQLDWDKVAQYLRRELGLDGEMTVAQFPGGALEPDVCPPLRRRRAGAAPSAVWSRGAARP